MAQTNDCAVLCLVWLSFVSCPLSFFLSFFGSCASSWVVPSCFVCFVASLCCALFALCVLPFGGCSLFPPPLAYRDVMAWFSGFSAGVFSRVSGCFRDGPSVWLAGACLSLPSLVSLHCSLPVWCSGSPGSPSSWRLMATKASALCGAPPSPPRCVCRSGAWCLSPESVCV